MRPMFDPRLPELSDGDPRLCRGRDDWEEWPEGEERPDWMGPEPYTSVHRWQGNNADRMYCGWCECTSDHVRRRFAEWRYEDLIARNTEALESLVAAVRRLH